MENYRLAVDPSVEEKVASLFQPDTILPPQYLRIFRKTHLEPEKRLMLAILEDAIASFQKYLLCQSRKAKMLFNEAEDWIFDEDWNSVFCFENVCEMLDLDPAYIRDGLRRWKGKKLAAQVKSQVHVLPKRRKPRRQQERNPARDVAKESSLPVYESLFPRMSGGSDRSRH